MIIVIIYRYTLYSIGCTQNIIRKLLPILNLYTFGHIDTNSISYSEKDGNPKNYFNYFHHSSSLNLYNIMLFGDAFHTLISKYQTLRRLCRYTTLIRRIFDLNIFSVNF